MGRTKDHIINAERPEAGRLCFSFPGNTVAVRSALQAILSALRGMKVDAGVQGVVEIVLAEALNNVVEHAFAGAEGGSFEVSVERRADALAFRIVDNGLPMPDGGPPQGQRHDLDVTTGDLPEGGFGWFLIRELTRALTYDRRDDKNILSFCIGMEAMPRAN